MKLIMINRVVFVVISKVACCHSRHSQGQGSSVALSGRYLIATGTQLSNFLFSKRESEYPFLSDLVTI